MLPTKAVVYGGKFDYYFGNFDRSMKHRFHVIC